MTVSRFAFLALFLNLWTWLKAQALTKARHALLKVLSAGPVPQHIAFVMDGNRRHARRHHKRIAEGHFDGFTALQRILEICLKMNVRCVTAFAFALENFKRSEEEVEALMDLAEKKLGEMCQHGEMLDRYGVRLNILGRKELLPPRVREAARKAEEMTRHNDRAILNLCMPYGSRDDMTTAVQKTIQTFLEKGLSPRDITEEDIDAHMMTSLGGSPPVDVLIRSSGVKRLSDFLLWQCCDDTQIQFSSTYWPDFGLWDLIPVILDFQRKVWSKEAHKAKLSPFAFPGPGVAGLRDYRR
ncbi:dehydrodolichyl diphosphate synthetase [Punctularia strigosozonata HHB-11173 SS5]|uniref:dehydrodolichyl diphosphate synthetase n=1 Tax=Punctularia strigosozonata (strain HHB-11173) TaxID=741275 RepID=UPI00044170F9|nr:dehydrodolichyl diphosphate synthetase [Punctularia strigosozonata HHB-11173 SS5]EIN06968.1 dehydrodolichyl diphosphate synthetase [Punctularia strigosozonata HHB-11173 SS5]